MAQVSDSIAATVTLKADGAIKDLTSLSKKAKETDRAFNQAGKSSAAAGAKIGDGANKAAKGVDTLGKGSIRTQATLAAMGGTVGKLSANFGSLGAAGAGVVGVGVALRSVLSAQTALSEATNASKITFKDAAAQVERFAAGASSIGLSKRAALEAAAGFGTLLRGVGFTTKAAADFSTSLTTLSADLASTFGGSVEEASQALRALFRGEADPIERYGIKVNEAAVNQRALQLGLAGSTSQISEQDKTLARLTLAYTQSTAAQGDFSRTMADTANQQRIAAAQSENLRASIGAAVAPGYTQALQGINATLGFFEKQAQKSGTSVGDLTKTFLKFTTVAGFIGSQQKDTADNFKGSEDALKTFSQELQAGREGSQAYTAAVSYLKTANSEAEVTAKKLADAIGDQGAKMAAARAEAQQNLGTIQSLTNAQRSAQDATVRVSDARTSLADAERTLNELRAKGKVDAQQVADAELRVRDASQATADARQRHSDAERRLGDLRAKGAVDAERVADAERSIADASRGLADARRAVAEAEREIARLRAGPTGDESADAARAITRAELDLERAQQRQIEALNTLNQSRGSDTLDAALGVREAELGLAEAMDSLKDAQEAQIALNARGQAGSEALADAEQRLLDARQREVDAVERQNEAQTALRTAQAGDPEFARNLAAAEREVDSARRGVESATRAEDAAARDLRAARAGDPEFDRNLARAGDAVVRARRDLQRAEQDLPFATAAARLAQQDFNAKISDGTTAAYNLASMAHQLGIQYDYVAGAANRAANETARLSTVATIGQAVGRGVVTGALGRANGGRVSPGTPYIVGERRPELFVPDAAGTILPRVGGGGANTTVVHTHITLDGREVARVVSEHQRGSSKRGGDVFSR